MPNLNSKCRVRLTESQRNEFQAILRKQSVPAVKVRRARVLLLADENHPDGRRRDWEIVEAVGISARQVVRIRQQFVRQGTDVLERKTRHDCGVPKVLDGRAQATLTTISCSEPPDGRSRWTLQMLCDELGRLKVVKSVSRETVRTFLKKTDSNLG